MSWRIEWAKLKISKERYRYLRHFCNCQRNKETVVRIAYDTCDYLAPYIIKSVTENRSYDLLEYDLSLGTIPCCKSDFYAYRRYFYQKLDRYIDG